MDTKKRICVGITIFILGGCFPSFAITKSFFDVCQTPKSELILFNINNIKKNKDIKTEVSRAKFDRLCRRMQRKINRHKRLSVQDCIICVRLLNSFMHIALPLNLDKNRKYLYWSLWEDLKKNRLLFTWILKAIPYGAYDYSIKYKIWIGGGTPGGANTDSNSYYTIKNGS